MLTLIDLIRCIICIKYKNDYYTNTSIQLGLFSFLESISFFLSKFLLCFLWAYSLAFLSSTRCLSRVLPFSCTYSVCSYEFFLCMCRISSTNSALYINWMGISSSLLNLWFSFNRCLNMLVIFSAMKGTDHSKRSKKFGRKYGWGFSKNCWISRVLSWIKNPLPSIE